MPPAAVRIEGLREFRRAVRKVDDQLPRALRVAFNDVAEPIVRDAQGDVPVRSGRAKGSIRARSTQASARIMGGGARVPYYPWLDFGGRVGRRNSVHRDVMADGRYIYPAYRRARDSGRIERVLGDALEGVARRAGMGVGRG